MYYCGKVDDFETHLQEEVAPFVLGNLGCAGDEVSVLDCPAGGIDDFTRDYAFGVARGRKFFRVDETSCDPSVVSYAKVACGMEELAGAPGRWPTALRCRALHHHGHVD